MTMTFLGLSELYASQFARLRRVGDSRAGDPTEAEEIVQDAFLRLIEAGTAPRGAGLLVAKRSYLLKRDALWPVD